MGVATTWSFSTFTTLYPEFGNLSAGQALGYFNQACVIWRNDGTGPVCDQNTQDTIMYLLTAHIAYLFSPRDAQGNPTAPPGVAPAPAVVGRVSSASEGSVSVSAEYAAPGNAAWFAQTTYGAMYWQAINPYRRFRYRPGPRRYFGTIYPSGRG